MNRNFLILLGVYVSLLGGCRPDTNSCQPPITKVYPDLYEYLADSFYPNVKYKNSGNAFFNFDLLVATLDTTPATNKPCVNPSFESFSLGYLNNYNVVSVIHYQLLPQPDRNITIFIGPHNSCESLFFLNVDSLNNYTHFDSLFINNKIFYDVYHRTESPAMCCTEMYYNKQYGVVGFNWQGEWYVLETDSL